TGNDLKSGPAWGYSNYDHVRFYEWNTAAASTARNGPFPFFTLAELDLLQAEGQYRLGNFAAAGALANKTRTRVGTATVPGRGLGGRTHAHGRERHRRLVVLAGRRITCSAAFGVALGGCYSYRPAGGVPPQIGTRVAFDVNDAGRMALGGTMGPEIAQVEGD